MADAGAGRDDPEVFERALAPLQEVVAFAVAGVFECHVVFEGERTAEFVDDDRVVDDQIDGNQRIDLPGIATERLHAVAHGGEINHGRHAGKVLHQDAGRAEADFLLGLALVVEPLGHGGDIGLGDGAAVFATEKIFEQHLHGEGQLGDPGKAVLFGVGQRVIGIALAADGQSLAAFEAVGGHELTLFAPAFPLSGRRKYQQARGFKT